MMVALNKCSGVRPVGIGKIWRKLLAVTVLVIVRGEAKEECRDEQLCVGLETGIEGVFMWHDKTG